MRALLLKFSAALNINQSGCDIREMAFGIFAGGITLRLDKDGPARTEPTHGVVQSAGDANEFGRHGGIQIRPPKLRRLLKRAILVEDDAFINQSSPGQEVCELGGRSPVFSEVHHRVSNVQMARDTQMPAHDVDKLRIAFRRPHRGCLTNEPEQETGKPQP